MLQDHNLYTGGGGWQAIEHPNHSASAGGARATVGVTQFVVNIDLKPFFVL